MIEQAEMDSIQNTQTIGVGREATLVWRNVNIYVKDKKKNRLKQIVSNSTGCIQPGKLMAVMGSRLVSLKSVEFTFQVVSMAWSYAYFKIYSGAGKSTLMAALAFRNMSKLRM